MELDSNVEAHPAKVREIGLPKPGIDRAFSGPISGDMWKSVSTLGSEYTDNFDWSIYDSLYLKYQKNPIKAGVIVKTGIKAVNYHASCAKCHYSLVIDTYGRGCTHNCTYCYAKEMLSKYGKWNAPHPFPLDLSEVRKIFFKVFETDKSTKWREVFEKRIPLRIGSMSDAFMPMEKKYGITRELLSILRYYRYPYIVFTRGDLVADDEYLQIMDPKLASIQMSICGSSEHYTKLIEPGTATISRRLDAVKKLSQAGFWTAVRIHPLFPTYPDGYFTERKRIIEHFGTAEKIPKFDLCDITQIGQFLSRISESGARTLLVGFVYLSDSAIKQIGISTGVNLKTFFRPEVLKKRGNKNYSDSEIAFYYKVIQSEAVKVGLRYTTCFVGNGLKDYYQYQDLWANKTDCCDVRGNVEGFQSSSQDMPWSFRKLFAPSKEDARASQLEEQEMDGVFNELKERQPGAQQIRFNLPNQNDATSSDIPTWN